jgi:hypothetical protein
LRCEESCWRREGAGESDLDGGSSSGMVEEWEGDATADGGLVGNQVVLSNRV